MTNMSGSIEAGLRTAEFYREAEGLVWSLESQLELPGSFWDVHAALNRSKEGKDIQNPKTWIEAIRPKPGARMLDARFDFTRSPSISFTTDGTPPEGPTTRAELYESLIVGEARLRVALKEMPEAYALGRGNVERAIETIQKARKDLITGKNHSLKQLLLPDRHSPFQRGNLGRKLVLATIVGSLAFSACSPGSIGPIIPIEVTPIIPIEVTPKSPTATETKIPPTETASPTPTKIPTETPTPTEVPAFAPKGFGIGPEGIFRGDFRFNPDIPQEYWDQKQLSLIQYLYDATNAYLALYPGEFRSDTTKMTKEQFVKMALAGEVEIGLPQRDLKFDWEAAKKIEDFRNVPPKGQTSLEDASNFIGLHPYKVDFSKVYLQFVNRETYMKITGDKGFLDKDQPAYALFTGPDVTGNGATLFTAYVNPEDGKSYPLIVIGTFNPDGRSHVGYDFDFIGNHSKYPSRFDENDYGKRAQEAMHYYWEVAIEMLKFFPKNCTTDRAGGYSLKYCVAKKMISDANLGPNGGNPFVGEPPLFIKN